MIHYDEELKSRAMHMGFLVRISDNEDPPRPKWFAEILISASDGYVELSDWKWNENRHRKGGWRFSIPEDVTNYEAYQELLEYLRESQELIELKAIGPEDSEYFATDKLIDMIDVDYVARRILERSR